jgi:hypothetical protein
MLRAQRWLPEREYVQSGSRSRFMIEHAVGIEHDAPAQHLCDLRWRDAAVLRPRRKNHKRVCTRGRGERIGCALGVRVRGYGGGHQRIMKAQTSSRKLRDRRERG